MSTEVCCADMQQFVTSRRSGRRNAMADLSVEGMDPVEAQKLSEQFSQMGHDGEPGTSKDSSDADSGDQK